MAGKSLSGGYGATGKGLKGGKSMGGAKGSIKTPMTSRVLGGGGR